MAAVWIGVGVSFGAAAYAADKAATVPPEPDIALLEYLGSLVEEQDRLIGPEDMQSPVVSHEPSDPPAPARNGHGESE